MLFKFFSPLETNVLHNKAGELKFINIFLKVIFKHLLLVLVFLNLIPIYGHCSQRQIFYQDEDFTFYIPKNYKSVSDGPSKNMNLPHIGSTLMELPNYGVGRLVILHGTPSSGKTSISKALTNYGWMHISLDDMFLSCLTDIARSTIKEPFTVCEALLDKNSLIKLFLSKESESNSGEETFLPFMLKEKINRNSIIELKNSIREVQSHSTYVLHQLPNKLTLIMDMLMEGVKWASHGKFVIIETSLKPDQMSTIKGFLDNWFPARIILNYAPFDSLVCRMMKRNTYARLSGAGEYRNPIIALEHFLNYYSPITTDYTNISYQISRKVIYNSFDYLQDNGFDPNLVKLYRNKYIQHFQLQEKGKCFIHPRIYTHDIFETSLYNPSIYANFIHVEEFQSSVNDMYRISFNAQLMDLKLYPYDIIYLTKIASPPCY